MPGTLCKRVILATGKCNLSVSYVQWKSTVRAQSIWGEITAGRTMSDQGQVDRDPFVCLHPYTIRSWGQWAGRRG